MVTPTFFRSAAELRAWLEAHHADRRELLVGFYKTRSAHEGITYAEALDEALCFGWIDGVRRSVDDDRYTMRFTPRKPRSNWSRINVAHVERLMAAGRMRPAGLAAYAARTAERTAVYSFEQREPSALDAARAKALRANARASAFFEAQPPSYRRTAAFWVMSAKQDATRDRRLASLIESSERGELAPPFAFGKKTPAARTEADAKRSAKGTAAKGSPAKGAAAKRSAAKRSPAKGTAAKGSAARRRKA